MRMACSRGHFSVSFERTPKKTTKDASPSYGITMVFLYKLETNPTKMAMVNDL
jgi:hypothetical protein